MCKYGRLPDLEKIADILEMTPPVDEKGVQRFLGPAQFTRIYLGKLAHITAPITALNHAHYNYKYPREWTPAAQGALDTIKAARLVQALPCTHRRL